MIKPREINVNYKMVRGIDKETKEPINFHVFTSTDIHGFYVAAQDMGEAVKELLPAARLMLKALEDYTDRISFVGVPEQV